MPKNISCISLSRHDYGKIKRYSKSPEDVKWRAEDLTKIGNESRGFATKRLSKQPRNRKWNGSRHSEIILSRLIGSSTFNMSATPSSNPSSSTSGKRSMGTSNSCRAPQLRACFNAMAHPTFCQYYSTRLNRHLKIFSSLVVRLGIVAWWIIFNIDYLRM
jgi:hypothetical protein